MNARDFFHDGNFLGTLALLSKFDCFITAHIQKHRQQGRGSVSYLSSTICCELIDIMGGKLLRFISDEVKEVKYFSLIVDSTPDISHVDCLVCILQYVMEGGPLERFLQFLEINRHSAEQMLKPVMSFFKNVGLDIKNHRGQSYNTASNMIGKYGGSLVLIREKNVLVNWVPCFTHSLNLVGHCAVDCVPSATVFLTLS